LERVLDLTRQLDLIPREELRAEVQRLGEHILEMGSINEFLILGIETAIKRLGQPGGPEDFPALDARRTLEKVLRIVKQRMTGRKRS